MKAIKINKYGGPEALIYDDIAVPEVNGNQALVKVAASGVNFIDIYQRSGLYSVSLPYTLGMEAAGVVEKIAPKSLGLSPATAWHLEEYREATRNM